MYKLGLHLAYLRKRTNLVVWSCATLEVLSWLAWRRQLIQNSLTSKEDVCATVQVYGPKWKQHNAAACPLSGMHCSICS